ncbi:carnitine operon oxidoreductase CaiA [Salmonella enterica subsp. enterica]|uniref:Carnitine operon oxidoreductase CaiA n=1 Tax=Salmonella enterica I TaxID=59201 RepID=A0A379X074_SALET|nr:carnitine operon oxidoreductase CaiA [Salmonella enterica subsp. enterica]
MGIDSLLIPEEHGGLEAGFVTVAAVWMELGRLGAPTYVLYQLPGGFNTFLREGTQEQIDKIMAFRAPVSRCGTLLSLNRERDRMLVV